MVSWLRRRSAVAIGRDHGGHEAAAAVELGEADPKSHAAAKCGGRTGGRWNAMAGLKGSLESGVFEVWFLRFFLQV